MTETQIRHQWRDRGVLRGARTAVSLHSHTMHSQETLKDIPRYAAKCGLADRLPRQDYSNLYWTPPLPARQAWELEKNQIERTLGLRALVSLTDHDNIEASSRLRLLGRVARALVSFEWTVYTGPSFLHLGVHNLPEDKAHEWTQALLSGARGGERGIGQLLEALNGLPGVLIVLNHPLWDEPEIGRDAHRRMLEEFLARHGNYIHALEWNGLRPWAENRAVVQIAASSGHPVVAGGDRHGVTPNTVLNLTRAADFEEFVWEIRSRKQSRVLILRSYRGPHWLRWLECAAEVLAHYPELAGRERWCDRVFVRGVNGRSQPLGEQWTEWFPEELRPLAPALSLAGWGVKALASSFPAAPGSIARFFKGA